MGGGEEETNANGDAKATPEYTRLLKQRGLNFSFKEAIESACRADAFTDLTSVCNSYVKHVVEIMAKGDDASTNKAKASSFGESMVAKGDDAVSKANPFSFGESKATEIAAPVFTFGAGTAKGAAVDNNTTQTICIDALLVWRRQYRRRLDSERSCSYWIFIRRRRSKASAAVGT